VCYRILVLATITILLAQAAVANEPVDVEASTGKTAFGIVLSMDHLVDYAARNNPQVASSTKKWNAAKAAAAKSWAIEKPWFSYEVVGEEVQTRVGPQEHKYGITQKLPFPTKIPLRARIAQLAAERAHHYILHTEQMIRTQLITAYSDLLAAQREIAVLEEERSTFEQIALNIAGQVATGEKNISDAAKVETEIAHLTERILKMTTLRVAAEERLNILLNQNENIEWSTLPVPPLPELQFDLETLKELALEHRHGLLIKRLLRDEESAKYELAKMEYFPDVEIGFNYIDIGDGTSSRIDDGQNAWSIPIKVNLPIWENQIRGQINEAKGMKESVEKDLEQMENETSSFVAEQYTRFITARERLGVYEATWLPQAEQALTYDMAAYRSGEANILDVLDSERMFLEAKIGYWRSYADTLIGHAEIEKIVGFPLDKILSVKSHKENRKRAT